MCDTHWGKGRWNGPGETNPNLNLNPNPNPNPRAVAAAFDGLDMTCIAARTVAAETRQRIALRLDAWGLPHLSDDVQLVAAELVANACAITPGGWIGVRFQREAAGSLLLAVWDASDRMPRVRPIMESTLADLDLRPEHFDDNGGRGLQLVQALSTECGTRRTDPRGKWVWSRFAHPSP